jgi:hypothetical protein
VKTIPVIEVAFHHHFVPAQIVERARPDIVVTSIAAHRPAFAAGFE